MRGAVLFLVSCGLGRLAALFLTVLWTVPAELLASLACWLFGHGPTVYPHTLPPHCSRCLEEQEHG